MNIHLYIGYFRLYFGEHTGNSLFVLIDKQTLSLWFPMELYGKRGLVCIGGHYADSCLPEFKQLIRMDWIEWIESHPDSKFVT